MWSYSIGLLCDKLFYASSKIGCVSLRSSTAYQFLSRDIDIANLSVCLSVRPSVAFP